jgi:hypothetical protein
MNFLLGDSYTLEQERFISNHSTIEMCELCGDWFPVTKRFCDRDGIKNIQMTFEGNYYCEKCNEAH